MTIRIISDLHLDESRPDICGAFFHYLQSISSNSSALYILGDFFEAWVGDDDDNAFIGRIKSKLKQASEQGLAIFFMHGNRDFAVGELSCHQTGCQLINDPYLLTHNDQDYLLLHGDSLCTDDVEYQAFRQQIRKPEVLNTLLAKPIDERRQMAAQLRQQSRSSNANKADNIMDVNAAEVDKVMLEHKVRVMIHGHTHRPAVHTLASGKKRIVLGDWDQQGWQIVLEAGAEPKLEAFELSV